MAFHARLKELREKAGLTQGELAGHAGMSQAGIANLEQDRTKPAWETVQKLVAALGVSCEAFNEKAESDEPSPRGRPRKTTIEPAKPSPAALGDRSGSKAGKAAKGKKPMAKRKPARSKENGTQTG
jgi:transcriptional regulator with XRE-family HTH domain